MCHLLIHLNREYETFICFLSHNAQEQGFKAGEDFADLARRYSEDRNSATRGGELPWFGVGNKPKDFETGAFSVENIGDYSEPILTELGWYIFKLIDRKIECRVMATKVDA